MSFNYGLMVSLDEWAAENGWRVLHVDERGLPNRLLIELTNAPTRDGVYQTVKLSASDAELPPLGIHVSDKIVAKEKLGGGGD